MTELYSRSNRLRLSEQDKNSHHKGHEGHKANSHYDVVRTFRSAQHGRPEGLHYSVSCFVIFVPFVVLDPSDVGSGLPARGRKRPAFVERTLSGPPSSAKPLDFERVSLCRSGFSRSSRNQRAYTCEVMVPDLILESIRRVAALNHAVRAVYLFGSQSAGSARSDSDVDLGVLYRTRQPLATTLWLEEECERAIGTKVDLVDASRAGAFLALEIVRGERIFCREPTETDRFELYVLRRAGDLLPFERQRQALLLGPRA